MARIKPPGITEAGCFAMIFICGASDTGSGFRQTEALKDLATVSQSFLIASNSNYIEPQSASLLQGTRKFLFQTQLRWSTTAAPFLFSSHSFVYQLTYLITYSYVWMWKLKDNFGELMVSFHHADHWIEHRLGSRWLYHWPSHLDFPYSSFSF